MNLMAIDPSTKSTGVAIFKDEKLVHYECISESDNNVLTRIDKITDKLCSLAIEYQINEITIEDTLREDVKGNDQVFRALMYLQGTMAVKFNKINLKLNKIFVASEWRKLVGIKTGRGVYRETLKKASMKLAKDHYNIDVNDDVSDSICIGIAYLKQQNEDYNWE